MRIVLSILLIALLLASQGSTAASTYRADIAYGFGPQRERVLPFGSPCARWLFQLRNGELFVDGHGPGTTREQATRDRKIIDDAGGVDLCAHGGKTGFQLVGEGCLFAREADELGWDKTTPEHIIAKMNKVDFVRPREAGIPRDPFAEATGGGFGVTQLTAKDLPITYLFKTVRGGVGILEILGIVEDERGHSGDGKGYGVKFRYRMVRQRKYRQRSRTDGCRRTGLRALKWLAVSRPPVPKPPP